MQRRVIHWVAGWICTALTSTCAIGCVTEPVQSCVVDDSCTTGISPVQAAVLKQVAIF